MSSCSRSLIVELLVRILTTGNDLRPLGLDLCRPLVAAEHTATAYRANAQLTADAIREPPAAVRAGADLHAEPDGALPDASVDDRLGDVHLSWIRQLSATRTEQNVDPLGLLVLTLPALVEPQLVVLELRTSLGKSVPARRQREQRRARLDALAGDGLARLVGLLLEPGDELRCLTLAHPVLLRILRDPQALHDEVELALLIILHKLLGDQIEQVVPLWLGDLRVSGESLTCHLGSCAGRRSRLRPLGNFFPGLVDLYLVHLGVTSLVLGVYLRIAYYILAIRAGHC